jgi:hypothetical protein
MLVKEALPGRHHLTDRLKRASCAVLPQRQLSPALEGTHILFLPAYFQLTARACSSAQSDPDPAILADEP